MDKLLEQGQQPIAKLLTRHSIANHLLLGLLFISAMSLTTLMFRSLVRLVTSLVGDPAASVTTILYYSTLLPQSVVLERLVRHELLDHENYLFHFLVNFLRCFW
ncbi:hypothetical protein EUGRSUZ_C01044 [Eucalyptus grandis]|uniref:Uncharacterized protein n=2 Tax=Eucalyptus grandis TaxID=71139 RepID=A0ACC3LCK2_EUCGR|nr:hypothetical protein EUGRSUZ_C01044 [Eucalyptus grandis]